MATPNIILRPKLRRGEGRAARPEGRRGYAPRRHRDAGGASGHTKKPRGKGHRGAKLARWAGGQKERAKQTNADRRRIVPVKPTAAELPRRPHRGDENCLIGNDTSCPWACTRR